MSIYIFWVLVAIMIAITLWRLVATLTGKKIPSQSLQRDRYLIDIYKSKLADLKQNYDLNIIDEEEYQQQQLEIESALHADIPENDNDTPISENTPNLITPVLTSICVCVLALGLYFTQGSYKFLSLIDMSGLSNHESTGSALELAEQLKQKLMKNPDNLEGWITLGKTYTTLMQYENAIIAFQEAYRRDQSNIDIMLGLAEVLAKLNNTSFKGKPEELVAKAKQLNPNSRRVLWFESIIAAEYQQLDKAVSIWKTLLAGNVNEQEKMMLEKLLEQFDVESVATAEPQTPAEDAITVQVALDDKIRHLAKDNDSVFIFAQASQGPKMPLAVVKVMMRDLPIQVSLSDENAMTPAMKLSNFQEIVIGARLSKTNNAMPASGDLQSISKPFLRQDKKSIQLLISDIIP